MVSPLRSRAPGIDKDCLNYRIQIKYTFDDNSD